MFQRPKTPWKAIFTSKPVWATFVAHIGTSTSYLFLYAQIPTYLHYILDVDIKSVSTMSNTKSNITKLHGVNDKY